MKKTIILPIAAAMIASLSVISCGLLPDVEFNTGYKEMPFTVEAPQAVGVHNLVDKVMASDIEDEIDEHGGRRTELKEVRIDDVVLEVTTPGLSLAVYDWVKVYVSADGAAEKLVATATNLGSVTVVTLGVVEADVMDMLDKDEYDIRIEAQLGQELVQDMDMLLKVDYKVVVGS